MVSGCTEGLRRLNPNCEPFSNVSVARRKRLFSTLWRRRWPGFCPGPWGTRTCHRALSPLTRRPTMEGNRHQQVRARLERALVERMNRRRLLVRGASLAALTAALSVPGRPTRLLAQEALGTP